MPDRLSPRARGARRGRHAKPSRAGQGALTALLVVAVFGGTAALALTPSPTGAPAVLATASRPLGPGATDVAARQEREVVRASRDRPAPVVPPAAGPPVVTAPEPAPPPPPPPPPVLPGCEDAPETGYANGRIPAAALCRLPDTGGHLLRADAARAFVQLDAAHRAERGAPLCLTDSYRSYDAQVTLRRTKRSLAAPPGTSNHGDGVAVDFCGGVESFRTAAHRWMQDNAGRFGWMHPSWAGPRGKRPEPWHWEYRG